MVEGVIQKSKKISKISKKLKLIAGVGFPNIQNQKMMTKNLMMTAQI